LTLLHLRVKTKRRELQQLKDWQQATNAVDAVDKDQRATGIPHQKVKQERVLNDII
jgi:hypothetical protein